MKSGLRYVLSFLAAAISLAIIILGLCIVISSANVGVTFVDRIHVTLFNAVSIRFMILHPLRLLVWLLSGPSELGAAYMADPMKFMLPFFAAAAAWLLLRSLSARIFRAFANKKTVLHGSSKWADEEELEKNGMLGETGVVLGQTEEAEYKGRDKEPPERKKGESLADFNDRRMKFVPGIEYYKMQKPGDLITHSSNLHTLVVGSTRSGKGVGSVIPTCFKWTESLIVLDPKGENWEVTSSFRSRFSYCFKFHPENPKESIHYNPLFSIRRGTSTMADIQNLCLSLIALNEQSKDPFWDNEARKLLAAVIGYVIYCNPPERKTFKEVYSIFTASDRDFDEAQQPVMQVDAAGNPVPVRDDRTPVQKRLSFYAANAKDYIAKAESSNMIMTPEQKEMFLERYTQSRETRLKIEKDCEGLLMDEDIANLDRIMQDLSYFAGCEPRQLSSVVSTMMSNLQVIADAKVQEVTSRSDFTFEDFVDGVPDEDGKLRPMSLYLVVSVNSMQRLLPLMKIIFEQAITLLCRELKKRPYRLLLLMDEFRQLGKMEIVEKALALSAGYGVLCYIIIQSYEQLKVLYQSDALFTDNFGYQIILRTNDDATCKKIENMLGQGTVKHTRMNTSGNLGQLVYQHESMDTQELGRSLMTAEEVRSMDDSEELIFVSGMHPYKAKKVRYYLDDRFTPLYRTKNGKGEMYPPARLEENYPHPENLEKDTKTGKMIAKCGLDREGWHLLLGYKADVTSAEAEAAAGTANLEREFDRKDSIIEDAVRGRNEEEEVRRPNPKEISDLPPELLGAFGEDPY